MLRLAGSAFSTPTVARPRSPPSPTAVSAMSSSEAISAAAAIIASRRPAMGLPAWASSPSTVISYQIWASARSTTPMVRPASSRRLPCSMWSSK